MSKTTGFSVRIFIPTGEPEALRIVEKSNWSGQGLVFPRALYGEVRKRSELGRTGVYVLWGPGERAQLPRGYVGEGDVVVARLDHHIRNKEFWTHAAVFTSKDQNLNKAHVQYLEARLVQLAGEAKRCELDNGNVPQLPALSEADAADAEGYLADLLLCLPIVGLTFFDKPRVGAAPSRTLVLKSRGIKARGFDGPEGFVVLRGSQAAKTEVASMRKWAASLSDLRKTLLDNGVLENAGEFLRLTQDYTFSSSSSAASVLIGRNANGPANWKDADGRTLKAIQESQASD